MTNEEGAARWLDMLAADEREAARAELVPMQDEAWEQTLARHQKARERLGSPKMVTATPAAICAFHGMMIDLAIERGELDYALATFNELGETAASRLDDAQVRNVGSRSAGELIRALVEAEDVPTAEQVYAVPQRIGESHPDDPDVVLSAAAAATYLVVGRCRQKDFEGALALCNDINHLYSGDETREDLDLWHARSVGTLALALVQDDIWDNARHLVFQRRDLLFSPAYRQDLEETHGAEVAGMITDLFESMTEHYQDKQQAPEAPAAPAGAVLDDYGFDRLQAVTFFDFITMRVPARWACRRLENGRWACYEEDVESGTFEVDYNVFDAGAADPAADPIETARREMTGLIESRKVGHEGDSTFQSEVVEMPDGWLIREYYENNDDGDAIAVFGWNWLRREGNLRILLDFALIVPLHLAERPDFKALVRSLEEEIAAAEVRTAHFHG